jgi:hypothetical protein
LVLSCGEQSPKDLLSVQLLDLSGGKYNLESTGCPADYYIDGKDYFDLPTLDKGLYLYYENTKDQFPSLNFSDNREGVLSIAGLPIKDVRRIYFQASGLGVVTGSNEYLIGVDSRNLPAVDAVKDRGGETVSQEWVEFEPVKWSSLATGNYRNHYVSIADTGLKNYESDQSPKVDCIKSFALYSSTKNVDGGVIKKYFFAGETVSSYFILDVDSGEVRYFGENGFFENIIDASKNGNIYFVNTDDFYLRQKELAHLHFSPHYVKRKQ